MRRRIVWRCNKRYIEKGKKGCDNKHIDDKVLYQAFIDILKNVKPIKEFDVDLFFMIVEKMTVFDGEKIIVTLLDGTEIEIVIE
ncbi:recombinase zinc beta ribbon domain-containing protein [Hathewaya limosa]|nr:recombinase zinc beta ribbon domain-containing protein [Hathewaya limosa]